MRPIYKDDRDRQEWQDVQLSFEQEEARDILISILKQLTENEIAISKKALLAANKSTDRVQDYIILEDYKLLAYEQYKEQCKLKCRLKEWAEIVYFRVPKVADTINEILQLGIYLQRDKEQGYIMRPIIGDEHWNKTQ